MCEQNKAIDMTPEELKQWLSSLTVPEDDEIPCYYFSASDPYLKHEPIPENHPCRNIRFDENGKNNILSVYGDSDICGTSGNTARCFTSIS